MNNTDHPDPEFVGNLERELRSTMRRQERFRNGSSVNGSTIRKLRWTTSLVALAAMCIGSAGTFAVTHRLRAQTAELTIAKWEAHLEFADARLEMYREESRELESRAEAGIVTRLELEQMGFQFAHVEAEAAARALDVEESRITGLDPNNSLSAPLLRGRDFVTQRLVVQQTVLAEHVALVDKQASRQGLDSRESQRFALKQEEVGSALSQIEDRLALRQDYLSGARTAREVELADMKSSIQGQHDIATQLVETQQRQWDRIQGLAEEGLASQAELRSEEMHYREAVLMFDLAKLEMQILEAKLADRSEE